MRIFRTLIIYLFISTLLSANELQTTMNSIPKEELNEIKLLFKFLFDRESFSYTLYGDKPLTLSDSSLARHSSAKLLEFLSLDQCCRCMLEIYSEPPGFLKRRWDIWEKYRHLFSIKKYFLFKKQYLDQIRVFFIHKENFKEIVRQNLKLFKKILGPEISPEILLKKFVSEDRNVRDIFQNNEALLGILLGFGKRNSILFRKREELFSSLEDKKNVFFKRENIEGELREINEKLQSLHEHDSHIIATINRIMFDADLSHPETIQLRNKYDELNIKIDEIYSQDDWFYQTLLKLTSD